MFCDTHKDSNYRDVATLKCDVATLITKLRKLPEDKN